GGRGCRGDGLRTDRGEDRQLRLVIEIVDEGDAVQWPDGRALERTRGDGLRPQVTSAQRARLIDPGCVEVDPSLEVTRLLPARLARAPAPADCRGALEDGPGARVRLRVQHRVHRVAGGGIAVADVRQSECRE